MPKKGKMKNDAFVRGKIFEEIIKLHLSKHGFAVIPEDIKNYYGVTKGSNGLSLKGRGTNHQIDALGQFSFYIPFVYPIRLLSEAKCYKDRIGLETISNFVGVLKDVSENYFVDSERGRSGLGFRFTDCGVIFSTSEFTKPAQDYAFAQGIYLVTITDLNPIVREISKDINRNRLIKGSITKRISRLLQGRNVDNSSYLLYFGIASGRYPLVIMSKKRKPLALFDKSDIVPVRISYDFDSNTKEIHRFTIKIDGQNAQENWSGTFQLPRYIWEKYMKIPEFRPAMLDMKEDVLSSIELPLEIENIRRIIKFKLDKSWTNILRMENSPFDSNKA